MNYLNDSSLRYIGLILLFLAYFLWNNSRARKKRNNSKHRSFRRRYGERKKEINTQEKEEDLK